MKYLLLVSLMTWAGGCAVGPVMDGQSGLKNIVLIAGPKSHGPEGNGVHDYPWSVRLLKVMLDNSNIAGRVKVAIHLDGWPVDPTSLEDADTIMVVSDGRDGDSYSEALHLESPERAAFVEKQMRRGCGFGVLHFSTFAADAYGQEMLRWCGGYFDWETDGQREWYSSISTISADVATTTPNHPVLRGVKGFHMEEEFYYNMRLAAGAAGWTPLLSVRALGGREEDGNVVAWALQRPAAEGGGRGFGTTIGHYYHHWEDTNYRTMILNALAWTAGVEVPVGGVQSRYYRHDEIRIALEGVKGTEPAEYGEGTIRVLMVTGNEAHKWHNWETTTPRIKTLLERDPRVQVEVVYDFEALGQRRLADYGAVVLNNYCNWQDPTPPSAAVQERFSGYVKGGGGLVVVHFANGAFHYSLPEAPGSDWPEYRQMVRRVWNHEGDETSASGHDAVGPFTVEVTSVEHPITAGLESFELIDELYYRQQGPKAIAPLITGASQDTGNTEPLAWAYNYGKGRVFQTLLGHSEQTYDAFAAREMLRRGTVWAARGKVLAWD